MATGTVLLPAQAATFPDGSAGNAGSALVRRKSTAAAPSPFWFELAFDGATDEMCMWSFRMPADYASAPVLKVIYKMTTAIVGTIRIEGRIAAYDPGVDVTDADAKAFGTTNSVGETVPGVLGSKKEISLTLTNDDGLGAGDSVILYLRRDADGTTGTDDVTTDMEVTDVSLEYTTT